MTNNRFSRFSRPHRDAAATNMADSEIDFGAARRPEVVEPGQYTIRIDEAKVVVKNENVSVALTLTAVGDDEEVPLRVPPLWVGGPNEDMGTMVAENRDIVGNLLKAAGLPTKGRVAELIPQLVGHTFIGDLTVGRGRDGRAQNTLVAAMPLEEDEKAARDDDENAA